MLASYLYPVFSAIAGIVLGLIGTVIYDTFCKGKGIDPWSSVPGDNNYPYLYIPVASGLVGLIFGIGISIGIAIS